MTTRERPTSALQATTRQVGYWIDQGWLRPTARGTGTGYRWTDEEWQVAVLMGRLVTAGLSAKAAHQVARRGGVAEIAPGITIQVERQDAAA